MVQLIQLFDNGFHQHNHNILAGRGTKNLEKDRVYLKYVISAFFKRLYPESSKNESVQQGDTIFEKYTKI